MPLPQTEQGKTHAKTQKNVRVLIDFHKNKYRRITKAAEKQRLQTYYATVFQGTFILQALASLHKKDRFSGSASFRNSHSAPAEELHSSSSTSPSFLPSAAVSGPLQFTSTVSQNTGLWIPFSQSFSLIQTISGMKARREGREQKRQTF